MRYAVVSDIHANWDALQAVLADAGDVDQVWCLGDIVDVGPQPNECLDALRERRATCIAGNHERWVLGKLPDHFRQTPLDFWAKWTEAHLSPANRAFIEALPKTAIAGDFTLMHYPDDEAFKPPDFEDLQCFTTRYCLVGHTHLPLESRYVRDASGDLSQHTSRPSPGETAILNVERAIINVGSVGGSFVDPRLAYYALLETEAERHLSLTFRAVTYSVERFVHKLQTCGVSPELAAARIRALDGLDAVSERLRTIFRTWYPE